jgi:hypothetical protein
MMEAPPSQATAAAAAAAVAVATTPIVLLLTLFFFFFFVYQILIARPRSKGGVAGPPLVTTSPVCTIPFVGTMVEFGRSPVKMVARCHERYGPVFTVPVRVFLSLICRGAGGGRMHCWLLVGFFWFHDNHQYHTFFCAYTPHAQTHAHTFYTFTY